MYDIVFNKCSSDRETNDLTNVAAINNISGTTISEIITKDLI